MGIPIRKPCVVYEDNTATIKIVNNVTAINSPNTLTSGTISSANTWIKGPSP